MTARPRVVVIGAGGHGKVVIDAIRAEGRLDLVGLVDLMPEAATLMGIPILGDDRILPALRAEGIEAAFIAIGNNRLRADLANGIAGLGFAMPAVIHPTAVISTEATVGDGTFVGPLAIINAHARIADLVIVNSGAIIEHDCTVDRAAHVAPGCRLAGSVQIGARTLVGIGSAVRPGVVVGADVVVGAGSAVVSDIPQGMTVFGVPAKPVGSAPNCQSA